MQLSNCLFWIGALISPKEFFFLEGLQRSGRRGRPEGRGQGHGGWFAMAPETAYAAMLPQAPFLAMGPWTACCAMTSQAPCATLAHWTAMAPWSAQSAMNGCRSIQGIPEGTPEHRDAPSERGGGWVNVSPVFPCLVFYSPCAFPMTYFLCRF